MFTFGREHERECALAYARKPEHALLLTTLIDAIHDLLEGKGTEAPVEDAIRSTFTDGGSGVWETGGKWLRKVGGEYPAIRRLWAELARHRSATVRFRIACFLDQMPDQEFASVSPLLCADRSRKVASMAQVRTDAVASRSAP